MAHQVADLDTGFAVRGEFRPVFGNRRIKIELALVCQPKRGQGCHGFGRGIDVDDRVLFPGTGLFRIGPAAPEIDDRLTILRHAERGADVGAVGNVLLKFLAYCGEFAICNSAHLPVSHASLSLFFGTVLAKASGRNCLRCGRGQRFPARP